MKQISERKKGMGREITQYRKGLWTKEEDKILLDYIKVHGKGQWNRLARKTGLKRCGKSCRLRWINYLCPNVKRGGFSDDENDLIIRLHRLLGNRWSLIAGRVPGRTDNQVKNYWNSHLGKKIGIAKNKNTGVHVSSQSESNVVKLASSNNQPPTSFNLIPCPCPSIEPLQIQKVDAAEPSESPTQDNGTGTRGLEDSSWPSSDLFDIFGDFSFDVSWTAGL